MIYLANPDNPMGSWHDAETVTCMLDALPDGTLLCLDEAYADLAPPEAVPPLDTDDVRVIRLRTFSKAHGLAGMRVGYAIGEAGLIRAFDKVRNHFGLGRVAQAGAVAALADTDWLAEVQARVAQSRDAIAAIARQAALIAPDIFVRMPGVAPLDRCIRISCGTAADMDALRRALPRALSEAAGS